MQLAKYMGRTWRVSDKLPYKNNPYVVMLEITYPIVPRNVIIDDKKTYAVHRTTAKLNDIIILPLEEMAAATWGAQYQ